MSVNPPVADRFEDRLLAAILDDFDNLVGPAGGAHQVARRHAPARYRRSLLIPALGVTAAAVAIGVAATAGAGHGAPRAIVKPGAHVPPPTRVTKAAGPVMQLASYRLRLPSSYRLDAATTHCNAPVGFPTGVGFASPDPAPNGGETSVSSARTPTYAPQMASAANAEGGCVFMVLAPPYTPTAANPDPEAGRFEASQPVPVGPYEGRVGVWTAVAKPSNVASQQSALYVEIPLANGQTQDLAVSSYNLSESALISLVANGLSIAGSS